MRLALGSALPIVAVMIVLASGAGPASAQEADVQAAAAAFQEGQRAQLRGDFAEAADLFEIADRAAPEPAALRSAIRNHRAAGQTARAATLAAEAQARYPDDAETSALATEVLAALTPTLGRLEASCATPCSLTLDGRAVLDHPSASFDVFVTPGEHAVVASWHGSASERRSFTVEAGQLARLEAISAPQPDHAEPAPSSPTLVETPAAPPPTATPSGGVHPALFGSLAGAAVVLLGVTIWSGLDTLEAAADYRDDPTHARYDDGVGRELRTNVLTAATAALAVAAFVTVFFTDWDDIGPGPDETVSLRPSFYATMEGGGVSLLGRY